ncbi:hypothetical protein GOP47_0002256 [Adiantum capillus-veneris]|uniref:non-specific serine/threonine protein kinase n=1 Tax=Adiantum capillus-veneris TaxID=13818 RepID=A0A9D4VAA3_ADICA|nr:hypothetical protein GOP47_0002256 [Adiantum capillus-veneris]
MGFSKDQRAEVEEDKMCSCWEGSLISFWTRSCKEETVVEASKGAKPVRTQSQPQSPASFSRRNVSVQRVFSDSGKGGSIPLMQELEKELIQNSNVRFFTYNELKAATRNFRADSALGQGGFGVVYKGWIDEMEGAGFKVVAVKVLNQEGLQGHREWLAEVNYLGQLHHAHLVKLMGYSCEDEHRLLVYEYMARGSLENHLFRSKQQAALPLSWGTRMSIALGAAKGLAFLHGSERPVIYRDFKTSNILLDSDYTAKLSDFGLAKDGPEGDKTHVSTRIMGTYGYAAPEYVMTGHLTARSDVYSFGVVLLELLTGRRSMDKKRPAGEQNLVEWAYSYLRDKRRLLQIVDPRLDGQYSVRGLQKAASLAYHCLSHNPKARPLMSDVVETLEPLQNMRDMANASYTYVAGNGVVENANQQVRLNGSSVRQPETSQSNGNGQIQTIASVADATKNI